MIASSEITVGGARYTVTTLPATRGFAILVKLPKYVGGALGELLKGGDDLAGALRELGLHLADPEFTELVYALLDGATVTEGGKTATLINGSRREIFDLHFAGAYGQLLELVIHAFKVNFGNFFRESPALAALLARVQALASVSPAAAPNRPPVSTSASPTRSPATAAA